ncbi:MAG: S-methyl-5'-thioadenosine phosphorylase [Armatimonadota bacterium]
MQLPRVDIGVFGGSGFYSLFTNAETFVIDTPYGHPSASITVAEVAGKTVAFMPRHGVDHTIPPHKINYRANLWAMKHLGASRIISPCACGSLQADIQPGHFVVVDQFVDRTRGRIDTFYDGPVVCHVSAANPYCPEMRQIAIDSIKEQNIPCWETGTMVVINGPRFSSSAESQMFTDQGWHTISMTAYPEVILAVEQAMCVVGIGLVTDYDCGLVAEGDVPPVTFAEVGRVFAENSSRIKQVVLDVITKTPIEHHCQCSHSLDHAILGH